jgi:hypothetical protein
MAFNNEIEKTEGEIKVLQAKLELLKEMENHKSPVEEAYKDWWGEYPGNENWTSNATRWQGFQAGYHFAYEEKVVEEPEEEPKPMDDVIDRLLEKYKSQKLWNMVRNELGYSIDCCDEIVDLVERWLPKEQSAEGSQNTFAIDATEGFNHCLNKIKGMLR